MLDRAHGDVSESFMKLQRIRRSFDEIDSLGRTEIQNLERLVLEIAAPCVRLCARELGSSGQRSRWASALLEHIAREERHRPRVLETLRQLCLEGGSGGHARMRASSLLVALGEELPPGFQLDQSQESASTEDAVAHLADRLGSAPGVAWAGDTLATRLPTHEMIGYLEELCERQPTRAFALLSELLLRDDLDDTARRAIKRQRAAMDPREFDPGPPPRRPVATATLGRHSDGTRALVAWRRIDVMDRSRPVPRQPGQTRSNGSRPRGLGDDGEGGYRVLCLFVNADGALCDGAYHENMPFGGAQHDVLEPLEKRGHLFETVSRIEAGRLLVRAARAARDAGQRLPRAFYMGRDLFDIYDQHAIGLTPTDDLPALLERAQALQAAGEDGRARPLFERYVAQRPDDADGRAGLAMALLALEDERGALTHLHRAVWLQPDNPNHHWNLAAVAHRQDRQGGCFLALVDYLTHAADEDDAAPGDARARREVAERFVAEYRRIARIEYPMADPVDVADVDEIVLRAWRCVQAGEYEHAASALVHALERVPEHYPALACMGISCAELGRLAEALEHLSRALTLRPGFPLALRAMERIRRCQSEPGSAGSDGVRALAADLPFDTWIRDRSTWKL